MENHGHPLLRSTQSLPFDLTALRKPLLIINHKPLGSQHILTVAASLFDDKEQLALGFDAKPCHEMSGHEHNESYELVTGLRQLVTNVPPSMPEPNVGRAGKNAGIGQNQAS